MINIHTWFTKVDRGVKRRQVKPLAASLLDALDYDSSDDSDFEVGDATGSDGTGNGSDEDEGSKASAAGSESDSENAGSADEAIDENEAKDLAADENLTEDEEKSKQPPSSSDGSTKETPIVPATKSRRKSKKTRNRPLLDFTTMEDLNEMDDYDSEDDNDWRPNVGKKKGKTGDTSSDSDKDLKKPKKKTKSSNAFDEELTNDSMSQGKSNEDALLDRAQTWTAQHILICCVCLGDNSEDADEIIQCDNCGVTVHEGNTGDLCRGSAVRRLNSMVVVLKPVSTVQSPIRGDEAHNCCQRYRRCYGVDGESDSIMSSASENSTEPWFCDACKNGVTPSCELCPNQDGIFKETDAGRWVHVVCALYVPGVAFGDIDKLRPECSFCEDARFSRTGVCISCDAGMCRSYFHVTCAQREGLLSEAAAEEDIADPFFAYCKQHADRFDRKWKRKNYLALQSYCKVSLQEREKQLTPEAQARITTRLQQYRAKAELSRNTRPQAWVPREKLPRPLTSSASAIRKLMRKAELMGISTDIFPVDTSDANASMDGRRKHKQPALTADFVNYYMERNMRMIQIQDNISEQKSLKDKLESEQEKLHVEYNKEIQTRIGKAATSFSRLHARAWSNKYLTEHTKTRIYQCCVVSILEYGSEAWSTYARHERELNAFHMRCLRNILGITWRDKVTNEAVLARTGSKSIFQTLKVRRLRWLGHLRRMPDGRLPKDILHSELSAGSRDRGRPLLRFKDVVKLDMKALDIATDNWERLAEDRTKWRQQLREGGDRLDKDWIRGLALKCGHTLCESLEELLNVNGDLRSEGQAVCEGRTLSGLVQTLSNTKQLLDNDLSLGGNSDCDFGNKIPPQSPSPLVEKLNTPAVLKAPKERKPSKKEAGTTGKASSLPAILY
ncbi:PHD finger protein 14, partial [Dissostichus eleginoides]